VTVGIADSFKPRVLLVEYSNRGGKAAVQVPSKEWMQTLQVQSAGGFPVWLEAVREQKATPLPILSRLRNGIQTRFLS